MRRMRERLRPSHPRGLERPSHLRGLGTSFSRHDRGREYALGLAVVENADVLVTLQGFQDVLHAVSQIDYGRFHGVLQLVFGSWYSAVGIRQLLYV